MNRVVPYRKKYKKLLGDIFTTIRPETGSSYYTLGGDYDHYHRKFFMFTATLIRQRRRIKLKDIPESIIRNDVDPPHNTKEAFYELMEKMYKDNYFRPTFWKGWDTLFQILWFKKIDILSRWA